MNLTDPIVIDHGVDKVYEKYGHIIEAASPLLFGVVDGGINWPSSKYVVDQVIKKDGEIAAYPGHATTCGVNAARFGPDKIHLIDIYGGNSHFGGIDGLIAGWNANSFGCSWSYYTNSTSGVTFVNEAIKGNIWATHLSSNTAKPGALLDNSVYPLPYPDYDYYKNHVIVAFGVRTDDTLAGSYNKEILQGLAVRAGAPSWAGPTVGSAVSLLKLLKPSATFDEIMQVLFETAEIRNFSWAQGVKWMRVDLAADLLLSGTYVPPKPAPTPDPEPEEPTPDPEPDNPEDKMYTETHTDERGFFATEQTYNTKSSFGPEGFVQGLDRNNKTKALRFSETAGFDYSASADMKIVDGLEVITGNDRSQRDPKDVTITFKDGSTETVPFTATSERIVPIRAMSKFDPKNVKRFDMTNHSGTIIQWTEFGFIQSSGSDNGDDVVNLTPTILTETLPNVESGKLYSAKIDAEGGDGVLTFSLVISPQWMTINSETGELGGQASDVGTFPVEVKVSDKDGDVDIAALNISVVEPNTIPKIETLTLPDLVIGESFNETISVTNGNPPFTFNITMKPEWVTLTDNLLTGTPTEADIGDYLMEVTVVDKDGDSDTIEYNFSVDEPNTAPKIQTETLLVNYLNEGEIFTQGIVAIDGNGTLTFSLSNNSEWVTITSDGMLSISPPKGSSGDYIFTVTVTDEDGDTDFEEYSIRINNMEKQVVRDIRIVTYDDGSVDIIDNK